MASVDLVAFGVSVIGGAGSALLVAASLGKTLIKHMLDREQKKFQADLDKQRVEFEAKLRHQAALEIEHVRGLINVGHVRHEIMLTRLQDRRFRVVGKLYEKLVTARYKTHPYVMNSTPDAESEVVKALAGEANQALHDVATYFARAEVWLPKDTAAHVEVFLKDVQQLQITRDVFSPSRHGPPSFVTMQHEKLGKAWEEITMILPGKLATLADELRTLLDPTLTAGRQVSDSSKS